MTEKPIQEEKRAFLTGNEVVAWAALAAKADIMYGYPITPQNEIMHYWTRMAPKFGKRFLQTEDELSAGFTTLGGVLAGRKAFTATAGPGNTLMQEPMSMAEMMRIPSVVVVQQRGGPSTATVIYSQQEVTMTTFGGNGEGFRIVYSPSNHQELFDYTIKAFNTAWKYRFPTFVLGDGYQAKLRESLTLYDPEARGIELIEPEPFLGTEPVNGTKSYTNMRNTYNTEDELYDIIVRYGEEYKNIAPEVIEFQEFDCEDADVVIVSHGVVSRAAKGAVQELRSQGLKAGYFRPVTLRPFPADQLRAIADKTKTLLLVESSYGQMSKLVKEAIFGSTVALEYLLKPGVGVTSEELVAKVKQMI